MSSRKIRDHECDWRDHDHVFDEFSLSSVAIVGGCDDFERDKIEHWDFGHVIRINNHVARQGGRRDTIFTCGMEPPDFGGGWVRWMIVPFEFSRAAEYSEYARMQEPDEIAVAGWEQKRFRKPEPLSGWYAHMNRFNHTIGTMPLTGIAAINYFVHLPVRSIFITGMTLYLDDGHEIRRTADGREQRWRDSHWIDPQVRWLKHLLTIDPRVTVDERLGELLAQETCINGYTLNEV